MYGDVSCGYSHTPEKRWSIWPLNDRNCSLRHAATSAMIVLKYAFGTFLTGTEGATGEMANELMLTFLRSN